MGVLLTPIISKEATTLSALRGRTLAVDGNGELYQFLALIRLRDGTPLRDSTGRITSHLSGLFYRTTRLMAEHALKFVFVFDGTPPARKAAELEKRRTMRRRYEEERAAALARGDLADAYAKATMTSRLTREMVAEARTLLPDGCEYEGHGDECHGPPRESRGRDIEQQASRDGAPERRPPRQAPLSCHWRLPRCREE